MWMGCGSGSDLAEWKSGREVELIVLGSCGGVCVWYEVEVKWEWMGWVALCRWSGNVCVELSSCGDSGRSRRRSITKEWKWSKRREQNRE